MKRMDQRRQGNMRKREGKSADQKDRAEREREEQPWNGSPGNKESIGDECGSYGTVYV